MVHVALQPKVLCPDVCAVSIKAELFKEQDNIACDHLCLLSLSMAVEGELQRPRNIRSEHQSDFTATVQVLSDINALCNCMERGPTSLDEALWVADVCKQWTHTLRALSQLFRTRYSNVNLIGMDSAFDEIHKESFNVIGNFGRGQESSLALRVGRTISDYASRLKRHLDFHHAWGDADRFYCRCCRSLMLQRLQESAMYQLMLVEDVEIPW